MLAETIRERFGGPVVLSVRYQGDERFVIDRGGFLSRRTAADLDDYDGVDRRFAELLLDDRQQGFDASDSFLSEVRQVLMEQITVFVAEANYLDPANEIDRLVEAVDSVAADIADTPAASDDGA
jgi:hypothetical protein